MGDLAGRERAFESGMQRWRTAMVTSRVALALVLSIWLQVILSCPLVVAHARRPVALELQSGGLTLRAVPNEIGHGFSMRWSGASVPEVLRFFRP